MLTTDLIYLLLTAGASPGEGMTPHFQADAWKVGVSSWVGRELFWGKSGSSQAARHPMSFGGSRPICSELRGRWILTAAAGEVTELEMGRQVGHLWGTRGSKSLSLALLTSLEFPSAGREGRLSPQFTQTCHLSNYRGSSRTEGGES